MKAKCLSRLLAVFGVTGAIRAFRQQPEKWRMPVNFDMWQATKCCLYILGLSVLSVFPNSAGALVYDFEDGNTSDWLYATTGGSSSYGVEAHNSSQMAYVAHTGSGSPFGSSTTSSSLTKDFGYVATDLLSFDMHAIANTASGNPSGTKHSGSGVNIQFLNFVNVSLGSVGLYNYTNPALLGPNDLPIDNTQHNYSGSMSDFATLAGLGPASPITKLSLTFTSWAQFSGGGNIYPNVGASAKVWFDDVIVGAVPEPEIYALMLVGLGLVGYAARRRKRS